MQMKRTGLLATLLVASGAVWAQSTGPLDVIVMHEPGGQNMVCMAVGKQPCTSEQVKRLATETSKRGVTVSLAKQDGALKCATRDGKACTDAQVAVVQAAGKAVGKASSGS
jgi:hypothetical protein